MNTHFAGGKVKSYWVISYFPDGSTKVCKFFDKKKAQSFADLLKRNNPNHKIKIKKHFLQNDALREAHEKIHKKKKKKVKQ